MAPAARNTALATKIEQLRLALYPIYPVHIPDGSPHPRFPRTLLHFWLLTEDEIDSFAHYYSQSTPSVFTCEYPAPMGWEAGFLARPAVEPSPPQTLQPATLPPLPPLLSSPEKILRVQQQDVEGSGEYGLEEGEIVETPRQESFPEWQGLAVAERLAIKRRMVGKFIGLRGCDTPLWEMELKMQWTQYRVRREIQAESEVERQQQPVEMRRRMGTPMGKFA